MPRSNPTLRPGPVRPARAPHTAFVSGILVALLGLASAAPVRAADQMLDLAVADAKASRHASALLDVPVYMAGEKHPAVAQKIGSWPTSQRTNAFGKAKTDACHRVFISALRVLQQRAQREGGNAVIDVESSTMSQPLKSATQFRCAAGALMANVALTGTVVKLAGK
ncbi:MAG: excinuclease ABC subunit A [Myxococcota bacterium]